ncbi:MAG: metallopeptidase TldD-related protein, partial [Acetomicrobium sp.]
RMDGVPSTGNCVRGTGSLPEVGASNLFITPGTRNLRSLLSGISFGIYVVDLLGLHTFDSTTGDLSLGVKGACIRKGMIEEPVSGMTIAGNIYDILSRVVEVGSDLKFYGSVGSPSLVIEDVASAGN